MIVFGTYDKRVEHNIPIIYDRNICLIYKSDRVEQRKTCEIRITNKYKVVKIEKKKKWSTIFTFLGPLSRIPINNRFIEHLRKSVDIFF